MVPRLVLVYLLAYGLLGMQYNLLGALLPTLAVRLSVPDTALDPLFAAMGLASVCSGPPAGWLIGRVPIHVAMVAAMTLQAAGLVVIPAITSLPWMTAAFFMRGLSVCFLTTSIYSSIMWTFPGHATIYLNAMSMSFALGSCLAPLLARASFYSYGDEVWSTVMLAAACFAASQLLMCLESPVDPDAVDAANAAAPVLWTSGHFSRRRRGLRAAVFGVVLLIMLVTCAAEEGFSKWIYSYCMRNIQYTPDTAALVNTAFYMAFFLGRLLGVLIAAHAGPFTTIMVTLPLAILGCLLPVLAPAALAAQLPAMLATAALVGVGCSTGFSNPAGMLEGFTLVTPVENGVIMAVAGVGNMMGPVLVAQLASSQPGLGLGVVFLMDLGMFSGQLVAVVALQVLGSRLHILTRQDEEEHLYQGLTSAVSEDLPSSLQPLGPRQHNKRQYDDDDEQYDEEMEQYEERYGEAPSQVLVPEREEYGMQPGGGGAWSGSVVLYPPHQPGRGPPSAAASSSLMVRPYVGAMAGGGGAAGRRRAAAAAAAARGPIAESAGAAGHSLAVARRSM